MPPTMMRTWVRASDLAVSLAAGTTTLIDLFADYETEKGISGVRGTVAAFYGEASIVPQALLATGVTFRFGFGIGILDKQAAATTVPNPTSQSFPWMWRWEAFVHPTAIEAATDAFRFQEIRKEIAIRSQRVMRSGQSLFCVMDNLAGAALTMTITGNILLKQG